MKYLIIFLLLCLSLWGDGFNKLVIITQDLTSSNIKHILEDAQNGTVFRFQKGKYTFENNITIKNKTDIALISTKEEKTLINGNIIFENISNLKIENLIIKKSQLQLTNTHNFNILSSTLIDTPIQIIKDSQGIIKNIKIIINKRNIPSIFVSNSSLYFTENSIIGMGLKSTNSKVEIIRNKFSGTKNRYALSLYQSSASIEKNDIEHDYFYGIFINSSLTILDQNTIKQVAIAISVNHSKAIVNNNILVNLKAHNEVVKKAIDNPGKTASAGLIGYIFPWIGAGEIAYAVVANDAYANGIRINDSSIANILNNRYSSDGKYCGYASKKSLVYLKNNDKGFELPGWGDSQVSNAEIPIDIEVINKLNTEYSSLNLLQINQKDLKIQRSHKTVDYTKHQLLKGYLVNSYIFSNNGKEESIEKGTYVIIDKNEKNIIEPIEYKNIKISKIPNLVINATQRKLNILSFLTNENSRSYISFEINTNTNLKDILFDGIPLKIKNYQVQNYRTVKRRVRDNYTYPLIINGNDFSLRYSCRIEYGIIKCEEKKKKDL